MGKKHRKLSAITCPVCGMRANFRDSNDEAHPLKASAAFDANMFLEYLSEILLEVRPNSTALISSITTDLSEQEKIVLFTFLRTPAIKQIAHKLGKQTQTIRNQLNAIREKLSAESMCDLLRKVLLTSINHHPIHNYSPVPITPRHST